MTDVAFKMPDHQPASSRPEDALSKIGKSCLYVVKNANDVHIDYEAITRFARTMPRERSIAWQFSGDHHYTGDEMLTLRYVLCIGAINFGSGYANDLVRSVPNSTYYTIAGHLRSAVLANPAIVSTQSLQTLTVDMVQQLFGQAGNTAPEARALMREFTLSLNELGNWLDGHYGDDLDAVIRDLASASGMMRALLTMPRFRDVSRYRDRDVFYYKRAQLLIADLARVGREFGWWQTNGLERLTIFADNAVAHVLRRLGLLTYSDALADRIDRGEFLIAGEPAENEIRAATIVAGDTLKHLLAKERSWPTILEIDHYLWDISHNAKFRNPSMRRHLCRTIAY